LPRPGEAQEVIRWAVTEAEIECCFAVMHQLRPALSPEEYLRLAKIQVAEGLRIASLASAGEVVCVANVRLMTMLATGRTIYVEDLVTDAGSRSRGHGRQMLDWLTAFGREQGCRTLSLESGTHRSEAHAFYFRQGLRITDFHFQLPL
jgi:GNAT superfamily N-acetyltransferase